MSHNCFISFKKEDIFYRDAIVRKLSKERILGKSLDQPINSDNIEYVMQVIRENYMKNTSVTIYLIGEHSSEFEGFDNQGYNHQNFIIQELKATLYDGKNNRRSGLLGVVLPSMYSKIYKGSYICSHCGEKVSEINISDETVLKEFSENYWLQKDKYCNHYSYEDRFCVLVKYNDFMNDPDKYIDGAFNKTQMDINDRVHWRDINHEYIKKEKVGV